MEYTPVEFHSTENMFYGIFGIRYDPKTAYDIRSMYSEFYHEKRDEFIEFTKSPKFRTHDSNDLSGYNSCTLGNDHETPFVGRVLESVLSRLKVMSGLSDTEKFVVVEIGAGTGESTPGIVSAMTNRFCGLWISTDPIYKPFGNFVPREDMPATITQGLTNPKTYRQAEEFKQAIEKRQNKWKSDKEVRLRRSGSYESPFRIISETNVGVFDAILKIKRSHMNNSILFICCPPPFEGHISTDLISLMESIDVEEIKYVIIVRHETRRMDGTDNFSDHANMLSQLGYWYNIYSQRVCSYMFSGTAYWRRMYVFSRNDIKLKK